MRIVALVRARAGRSPERARVKVVKVAAAKAVVNVGHARP
jgi:hypothetical protein